jgi:hypothetical protein
MITTTPAVENIPRRDDALLAKVGQVDVDSGT